MTLGRAGAGIAVAAAVALSGCGIDKADEQTRQLDVIGDVEITTILCTGGDTDEEAHGCAPYTRPHRGQVLVAYRLPAGSAAPPAIADDGSIRHFSRSDSYTDYMEATYPEAGMRWAGYVSDVYSNNAGNQFAATLSPSFPLPDPGTPFAAPFRYLVVGGWRTLLEPGDDGSAQIDCLDSVTTSCTSTGVPGEDALAPTRDLAVLAGASEAPVIEAGGHGAVPFDLQFAGTGGEAVRFELAASSELFGATLSLGDASLSPSSDSHNPVSVDVSVPAGTPAGTYSVDLTATAVGEGDIIVTKVRTSRVQSGGVERRVGRMTFQVVDPSPPPPDPEPEPPAGPHEPPPVVVPPQVPDGTPPVGSPRPHPHPRPRRARFKLSLVALPRHAYSGSYARYRVVARNASHVPATRTRVCTRLPATVQFVQASRPMRFAGRRLCFGRHRLSPGGHLAARVLVHVDTDARPGLIRADCVVTAANADRALARARVRVMSRPVVPRPAPVTG
jgi:uncharacterized repeat protein (TIGR01451 family)